MSCSGGKTSSPSPECKLDSDQCDDFRQQVGGVRKSNDHRFSHGKHFDEESPSLLSHVRYLVYSRRKQKHVELRHGDDTLMQLDGL